MDDDNKISPVVANDNAGGFFLLDDLIDPEEHAARRARIYRKTGRQNRDDVTDVYIAVVQCRDAWDRWLLHPDTLRRLDPTDPSLPPEKRKHQAHRLAQHARTKALPAALRAWLCERWPKYGPNASEDFIARLLDASTTVVPAPTPPPPREDTLPELLAEQYAKAIERDGLDVVSEGTGVPGPSLRRAAAGLPIDGRIARALDPFGGAPAWRAQKPDSDVRTVRDLLVEMKVPWSSTSRGMYDLVRKAKADLMARIDGEFS